MAEETKTSKVRAAVYSGRNFNGKKDPSKTFYVHRIEMENGDSGDYSAMSIQQTDFIIGQEVTYVIKTTTNGNFTNTSISPVRKGSGGGKGGYKQKELDPKIQMRIAKMVAYECTIDFLKESDHSQIQKGHDYAISKVFLNWIITKGLDSENGKISSRALREAIHGMKIKAIRIENPKTYQAVLDKADEIFNYFIAE